MTCEECQRQFQNPSRYREHLKREHPTTTTVTSKDDKKKSKNLERRLKQEPAATDYHPMVLPSDEFENKMDGVVVTTTTTTTTTNVSSNPIESGKPSDLEATPA